MLTDSGLIIQLKYGLLLIIAYATFRADTPNPLVSFVSLPKTPLILYSKLRRLIGLKSKVLLESIFSKSMYPFFNVDGSHPPS